MRPSSFAPLLLLAACASAPPLETPPPQPEKRSAGCRYEDAAIDKTCSTVADCEMLQEIVDCCSTTIHVGVSKAGKSAFDRKPKKSLDCPPGMSCVVRWMRAEDCDESSHGTIELECASGLCMTRVAAGAKVAE